MKTKPILFNGEMVRAILDGRKTQTRRGIKKLCGCPDFYSYKESHPYPYYFRRRDAVWDSFKTIEELAANYCPFGTVGDRLWVRETWADTTYFDPNDGGFVYKATDPDWADMEGWKWKPSIHMPREVSRITLEITGVRVEKLNDISEDDAIAEGIALNPVQEGTWIDYPAGSSAAGWKEPRKSFQSLWQSVYSNWDANPWVWVIEFSPLAIAAKEESQ